MTRIKTTITSGGAIGVDCVDYSQKLSDALEWLGDRHLLAEPQRRRAEPAVSTQQILEWPNE